jgi:hypothetical protein
LVDFVVLSQCSPTLSPFATCGDRPFKCGNRKFFSIGFIIKKSTKLLFYSITSPYCGDSKEFVVTKVSNVSTKNILVRQAMTELPQELRLMLKWAKVT